MSSVNSPLISLLLGIVYRPGMFPQKKRFRSCGEKSLASIMAGSHCKCLSLVKLLLCRNYYVDFGILANKKQIIDVSINTLIFFPCKCAASKRRFHTTKGYVGRH